MKIIIKDKRIIATATDEYDGPEEFLQVPEEFDVAKLDRYRVEQWNESPFEELTPTVPESITPRQGYIILSRYGILASVKAHFEGLTGQEGEEAKIELEYAQEWKRTWPTLVNAATLFGLTSAQIDKMFIEAAAL